MNRGVVITPWALVAILSIVLGSTAFNWVYHLRVVDRLDRIESKQKKENLEMLTTTWLSGGQRRTWTSTQREGETIDDLAVRHAEEVAALQVRFPPDPDDGTDD